jgi:hypothetical protein
MWKCTCKKSYLVCWQNNTYSPSSNIKDLTARHLQRLSTRGSSVQRTVGSNAPSKCPKSFPIFIYFIFLMFIYFFDFLIFLKKIDFLTFAWNFLDIFFSLNFFLKFLLECSQIDFFGFFYNFPNFCNIIFFEFIKKNLKYIYIFIFLL